jgi:hypothetical protein
MGMLFNSGPTLDILSKLNSYYGAGNIDSIRNTIGNYLNWPPGGAGGTYAFAQNLGLVPAQNAANWQTWLGLLEVHDNAKKGGAEKCVRTVGDAIHAGLDPTNNYQAIEFFAVPEDSGVSSHISVEAFPVIDSAGNKTLVINAYTLTHDKLARNAH